ncbi:UNVERIFIED_CONTAM: hypothetical protein K2H54_016691 [Gekko kuhli]
MPPLLLLHPAAPMAVARKIKTLLTVNILVFVGIILFSVYCRIQDRSQELVQIVRSADRRMRSRNAKVVGTLLDRDSILQRLDHLEEVVYNQLNDGVLAIHFKKFQREGCKSVDTCGRGLPLDDQFTGLQIWGSGMGYRIPA